MSDGEVTVPDGGQVQPGSRIYFHSPCFDGIASAVIARSYLMRHRGWPEPDLIVVNYDSRDHWYGTPFPAQTAVVDFLFHPEAAFWADHHPTAFPTPEAASEFRGDGQRFLYDPSAKSCAGMLQAWLQVRRLAESRFVSLAAWADKIDSASYESVDEALASKVPAMVIAGSLSGASSADCVSLVRLLSEGGIEDVAREPGVRRRAALAGELTAAGLSRVQERLQVSPAGVAAFVVDGRGVHVNRYAAFKFAPGALYSAGLLLDEAGPRITVMRNPWRQFESIHLGKLCAKHGGGGHQRVGAVRFGSGESARARRAFASIIEEIERTLQPPARPA